MDIPFKLITSLILPSFQIYYNTIRDVMIENNNGHAMGKNRGTVVFPHSSGGVTKDEEKESSNSQIRAR